jgi:hypothetical protein
MSSRVRLKIGPVEVELESSDRISTDEILEIASAATELLRQQDRGADAASPPGEGRKALRIYGSTASIASRLNCISGPELILAAAAHLTFVLGEEWFEAPRLLDEMKGASAHYDRSYQSALEGDVRGLVQSGKIVEVSPGLYALSATMRRELQRALAQ